MSLSAGSPAPEFALFNTEKKEVRLSGFKGTNVVLLFFPLAFTGTCTRELCSVRDNYQIYENLQATVLAISVDSLFVLKKYKEEQSLNFELLSDFNKVVSSDYGCLYKEFIHGMKGVSKRSAFVIDREGKIQYAEILENASDLPDFENIQSCLKNLN